MALTAIKNFLKLEAASGIILFVAAVLALVIDNSPWSSFYQDLLQVTLLGKPLLFWINEGLMTVFFLLVGLELKREYSEEKNSLVAKVMLPGIAAVGGMVVPALIYLVLNFHQPIAIKGWAIPIATDIAYALGVLSLFGKRVPIGLKVFLLSLSIFDDLGAIIVIALFHSHSLSFLMGFIALLLLVLLYLLNRKGISHLLPYILIGLLLWVVILKSGMHATISGVLLAFFIPGKGKRFSPLYKLEDMLHPWVAYLVLPLFAFANAGLSFAGITFSMLMSTVTLGIIAGLVLGKPLGVLGATWIGVRVKIAKLPEDVHWFKMIGTALLCGIGFTMSLFLGTLAFQGEDSSYLMEVRLGVLIGSLISGVLGALLLRWAFLKK